MQQRELEALRKASLYSFPANKLGYCGPQGSWRIFQSFLSSPSEQNSLAAKEALVHFNALYPYLQLIARENNLQPFSPEAVEAYWLGNDFLQNVPYSEMQKTILSLQMHGLPRSIAEKKAAQLPDGILPHHSMHVLYVNFLTEKVKPIVRNLSHCLVQWGRVQRKTKKGFRVKGTELFAESSELKLREKEKTIENPFALNLHPNNTVAVHWNNAIERLSTEKLKNLKNYTFKNLEAINNLK